MKRNLAMDPREIEKIKKKVDLVERSVEPMGIGLVNPYAVGKHDTADLVELAKQIQKADDFVRATACGKLQLIAEQVRFLHQQAQKVLLEAKQNADLHHAACNFRKIPGHVYHLYCKPCGQLYFSMLSPEDWTSHGSPPHEYRGTYRLQRDMSWTPEHRMKETDAEMAAIDELLATNSTLSISCTFNETAKMDTSS